MCREPPWREPQLTRVSKSSQDAICHTGNRWRSWPLPTPKSSQTDQTRWLLPPKGVSGRRWQRHENQVILYKFSWRNVEARRLHICRSCGDYAAQRVSTSVATGSRLCIRHQSDVGGCTRLERGGGGGGVMTSTYWAPCPSWWVTGRSRSHRCLSRGNHSLQRYWNRKNDFVGKFNCKFLSPLMSLKSKLLSKLC